MRLAPLAFVLACASAPAAAATRLSAELSHPRISLDEQVVLSVTVSGDQASLPQPNLPPLDSFSVYNSGSSQSLSWINGRVSASVVYTYVLMPRAVGKFRIPAITAGGAQSQPLDVEVVKTKGAADRAMTRAGAASARRQDATPPEDEPAPREAREKDRGAVFVDARLDKTRAYVNEQVTLTVRFLYSVPLTGNSQYAPPSLTGFLTEDLPPVREGITAIHGRTYKYSEIKTALFAIQPGRLTIGPATVHSQVARLGGDPFSPDFFDRIFSMGASQPISVNSDPLTLEVEPLPAGKPDDFTGVVGRLSAKASADRSEVKTGDAVTLTVAVTGAGNLKSIPEPKRPDLPSLRFFETESSVSVDKSGDRIGGTKTFRTVVVPRASGEARVPPLSFSYFDPQRGAYARAETAPIVLRAAPGAPGTPSSAAPPQAPAPGLTEIGGDIRYLKTRSRRTPLSATLAAFADLGPWHALPFAALGAAAVAAWRRRAAHADPRGRRFRGALRRAEEGLLKAAALPAPEAARAAALADDALTGFVADKLDVPAAGLTLKAAVDGLKALPKPPSATSLERLRTAWEEADLRRFAPGAAGDAARFAGELSELLKLLDQEAGL